MKLDRFEYGLSVNDFDTFEESDDFIKGRDVVNDWIVRLTKKFAKSASK